MLPRLSRFRFCADDHRGFAGGCPKQLREDFGRHGDETGPCFVDDPFGRGRWTGGRLRDGKTETVVSLEPILDWAVKIPRLCPKLGSEMRATAKRLFQWISAELDAACSKGLRCGESSVTAIRHTIVLPKIEARPLHHKAMHWKEVPALPAQVPTKSWTCASGRLTGKPGNCPCRAVSCRAGRDASRMKPLFAIRQRVGTGEACPV